MIKEPINKTGKPQKEIDFLSIITSASSGLMGGSMIFSFLGLAGIIGGAMLGAFITGYSDYLRVVRNIKSV